MSSLAPAKLSSTTFVGENLLCQDSIVVRNAIVKCDDWDSKVRCWMKIMSSIYPVT